jgi:hypothetical protein
MRARDIMIDSSLSDGNTAGALTLPTASHGHCQSRVTGRWVSVRRRRCRRPAVTLTSDSEHGPCELSLTMYLETRPWDTLACFGISQGYLIDRSEIWPCSGYPMDIFWGFWDISGISQPWFNESQSLSGRRRLLPGPQTVTYSDRVGRDLESSAARAWGPSRTLTDSDS